MDRERELRREVEQDLRRADEEIARLSSEGQAVEAEAEAAVTRLAEGNRVL